MYRPAEATLGEQGRGLAGKCRVVGDGQQLALGAVVFAFEVTAVGVVVKGGLLVGTAHFDNSGEAGSGLFGIAFLYIGAAEVQQQVALFFG